MIRILSTMLVVLLWLPLVEVGAEKVDETKGRVQTHKKKIGEVQEEIKRSQAQLKVMRKKERLILDQLDQMELELQEIYENLDSRKRERASLRKEISEKRKKLKQLNQELEKLRSLLAERLAALYKFGSQAYLNLLASARDVSGFQHHWVYLRAIAEQDGELIHQFLQRQEEEEKLTKALTSREEQLGRLVEEIGQQRSEMEKVKREQVALLQSIHNQEATYQRYVAELAGVSRELKSKIDELQRKGGSKEIGVQQLKGGFASNRGTLPYPVRGKVVSRFGPKQHKIFGTKIRNNGIEIATEPLSAVVAVYPGQVLYAERVKGYGKVIIIDHGDKYYTLTGHLAEISKGTGGMVESGEVIGYAGYSPAERQGGRVYFEVRYLGKALNPESWLLPALARASGK
jgi:septal ring factor EnvC (AmiA/AmiB activator)